VVLGLEVVEDGERVRLTEGAQAKSRDAILLISFGLYGRASGSGVGYG
jgi:hypothetical protein